MSDARRGLPLLSGPPPSPPNGSREETACRKCSKEFNIVFTRRTRCNHCGYSYCSSCSDYQALMPRTSSDGYRQSQTGYESAPVCAFCIDNLNITASGRGQLKSQPLSKLRKYAEAYNIKVVGAVEKDDFIDTLMRARGRNGCLPPINENHYRKYSVPNHSPPGTRPRGLFSRLDPTQPSAPAPSPQPRTAPNRPQAQRNEFARPDLAPDDYPPASPTPRYPPPSSNPPSQNQYQPPPHPPPERSSAIPNLRTSPRQPPAQQPPACPRPQASPGTGPRPQGHPPPPRPSSAYNASPPNSPPNPHLAPRAVPRPRAASAAPRPPPAPAPAPTPRVAPAPAAAPAPTPTLDSLLNLRPEGIKALSVGTLKAILFQNHVNARLILEKSDLVEKVVTLVEAERSERERKARVDEEEERERHRVADERRARERADASAQYEEAEPEPESSESGHHSNADDPEEKAKVKVFPLPPHTQMAADLERTGLCVICQDEDANIAIVDCGHLAMCRGCSDLIMASSRECPLCRTRIVTEARLLRIYKT